MKTMRTALMIGVLLVLSACSPALPPVEAPAALPTLTPAPLVIADPAGLSPEQVVEAFYQWYIDYSAGPVMRNALQDGALGETGYLTEEYLARVTETVASFSGSGGGADPILWAQDIPQSVRVLEATVDGPRAQVAVASSFANHELLISLEQVDGCWLIDGVRPRDQQAVAPPPEPASTPVASAPEVQPTAAPQMAAPTAVAQPTVKPAGQQPNILDKATDINTADWQVYHNEEFGFRIKFPNGWTYRENTSEPGHPPIGPESLRLQVIFMPQAWADAMDRRSGPPDPNAPAIAPFTLEVSVGSWEVYRQNYIEPTSSEPLEVHGATGAREVEALNDTLHLIRYWLEDPRNSEVRVTLQDPIFGFPDRLHGNEEVAAQFPMMVRTLEFVNE